MTCFCFDTPDRERERRQCFLTGSSQSYTSGLKTELTRSWNSCRCFQSLFPINFPQEFKVLSSHHSSQFKLNLVTVDQSEKQTAHTNGSWKLVFSAPHSGWTGVCAELVCCCVCASLLERKLIGLSWKQTIHSARALLHVEELFYLRLFKAVLAEANDESTIKAWICWTYTSATVWKQEWKAKTKTVISSLMTSLVCWRWAADKIQVYQRKSYCLLLSKQYSSVCQIANPLMVVLSSTTFGFGFILTVPG